MRDDGYLKLEPVFRTEDAARAATLVQSLAAAGWPPPFLLVYDHVWSMLSRFCPWANTLLGFESIWLPDFWVWNLDGRYENSGFRWHRDDKLGQQCFDEHGRPSIVTVWLAFTDATADNGCMQILPLPLDPDLPGTPGTYAPCRPELLPYVREVPVEAGSILAWNMSVLHRGGFYTERAKGPRISLGMYLQDAAQKSLEGRPISAHHPLPLIDRLGMISRMVLRYHGLYDFAPGLLDFCTPFAELYDAVSGVMKRSRKATPKPPR